MRAFGVTEWREAWRYGCVGIADEDDFQGGIVNFDSHDNVALLSGIIEWIPKEKHYTVLRVPDGSPWGPVEVYQGGSDSALCYPVYRRSPSLRAVKMTCYTALAYWIT